LIKNSLQRIIAKWREIGTNPFILKVVDSLYEIPYVSNPPQIWYKNIRSALHNNEVVKQMCLLRLTSAVLWVSLRTRSKRGWFLI
jgi:hypothetical protein